MPVPIFGTLPSSCVFPLRLQILASLDSDPLPRGQIAAPHGVVPLLDQRVWVQAQLKAGQQAVWVRTRDLTEPRHYFIFERNNLTLCSASLFMFLSPASVSFFTKEVASVVSVVT